MAGKAEEFGDDDSRSRFRGCCKAARRALLKSQRLNGFGDCGNLRQIRLRPSEVGPLEGIFIQNCPRAHGETGKTNMGSE